MSYQTFYNLEWKDDPPDIDQVATFLALTNPALSDHRTVALFTQPEERQNETRFWKDVLQGAEETTWYTHQADMALVSRTWPHVTFTLHINGEDSNDFQIEYHRTGQVQIAPGDIVYPPFNPDKLQTPELTLGQHPEPPSFIHQGVLFRQTLAGHYTVPMPGQPTKHVPGNFIAQHTRTHAILAFDQLACQQQDPQVPPPSPVQTAKARVLTALRHTTDQESDTQILDELRKWIDLVESTHLTKRRRSSES